MPVSPLRQASEIIIHYFSLVVNATGARKTTNFSLRTKQLTTAEQVLTIYTTPATEPLPFFIIAKIHCYPLFSKESRHYVTYGVWFTN